MGCKTVRSASKQKGNRKKDNLLPVQIGTENRKITAKGLRLLKFYANRQVINKYH